MLAPRGMGTTAAMMIIGRITNRGDARVLLAAGLLLTAKMPWEMTYSELVGHVTPLLAALVSLPLVGSRLIQWYYGQSLRRAVFNRRLWEAYANRRCGGSRTPIDVINRG
jgi:hypothetical protein